MPRLSSLDLQGNNLITLPEDLYELDQLHELNLSSNYLSSSSTLVNPSLLFKALGKIPRLKKLLLSRNKFEYFHGELLVPEEDFLCLQELDVGFNLIQDEDDLGYVTSLRNLQVLIITGNEFAMKGKQYYATLEDQL